MKKNKPLPFTWRNPRRVTPFFPPALKSLTPFGPLPESFVEAPSLQGGPPSEFSNPGFLPPLPGAKPGGPEFKKKGGLMGEPPPGDFWSPLGRNFKFGEKRVGTAFIAPFFKKDFYTRELKGFKFNLHQEILGYLKSYPMSRFLTL